MYNSQSDSNQSNTLPLYIYSYFPCQWSLSEVRIGQLIMCGNIFERSFYRTKQLRISKTKSWFWLRCFGSNVNRLFSKHQSWWCFFPHWKLTIYNRTKGYFRPLSSDSKLGIAQAIEHEPSLRKYHGKQLIIGF